MVTGDEDFNNERKLFLDLLSIIQKRNYLYLDLHAVEIQGENKNTIFPTAITKGLRAIYYK